MLVHTHHPMLVLDCSTHPSIELAVSRSNRSLVSQLFSLFSRPLLPPFSSAQLDAL